MAFGAGKWNLRDVGVTLGALEISQYAKGNDVISVEFPGKRTVVVGADGVPTYCESNDARGIFKLKLAQNSPAAAALNGLILAQRASMLIPGQLVPLPFGMVAPDLLIAVAGIYAVFMDTPSYIFGEEMGSVEYTFEVPGARNFLSTPI